MAIKKQLARQDTDFTINPGNNNETSIKITDEISELFLNPLPSDKLKVDISFVIYKEDFFKSACNIISSLPLLDKHGKPISFSVELCNTLFNGINNYFGDDNTKLFNAELAYNTTRNSCIQGFKEFNIRAYLVESWSTVYFEKKADVVHMRLKFSKQDNVAEEEKFICFDTFQQIYYGAPGTGKSHIINEMTKGESVVRTTFHPDSDYSTFVGSYKPTTREIPMRDVTGKVIYENGEEVTENRVIYEYVPQAFLQAYVEAWKFYAKAAEGETAKKQFLIIEEINRGNCAQIFGDLFQLLDRGDDGFSDYPIHADKDLQKYLAKAFADLPYLKVPSIAGISGEQIAVKVRNGEILLLPNNLYIWATMNTSDQSLFPIDSAFKRRWDWQYMPICKGRSQQGSELDWSISVNDTEYDWWDFINKINARIGSTTNSEDKKLGFFFCKANQGKISAETFVGKVIFYLWNDVFKDFGFDNDIFNDEDGETLSFNKFYTTNIEGKVIVRKEKVEKFLKNLEVEVVSVNELVEEEVDDDETENTSSSSGKDFTQYSINGSVGYGKNRLAFECVKKYIELNPTMPADEVVSNWKSLGKFVPHFIESKAEYDARTDNSKDRSGEIPCGNTVLYVARDGYGSKKKADEVMKAVNAKDWGITITIVE